MKKAAAKLGLKKLETIQVLIQITWARLLKNLAWNLKKNYWKMKRNKS